MTTRTDCVATLQGLIERAERGELAEAQAAIIQYALASSDLAQRKQAMAAMQRDLADAIGAARLGPVQQAYYSVVDTMIDRTRDAVLRDPGPAAQ